MDSGRLNIHVSEKPISGCDVYHFHRPQLEAALEKCSVVTVHHDLNEPDPFVSWDRFESQYRSAEKIICLNTVQQNILSEKGIHNTTVIPHGYDSSIFKKKKVVRDRTSRRITLGIVSKRYARNVKGEVYLYELLDYLSPEEFDFILVGEGRSEDAAYLRSLGFFVELHEWLPYRLFPSLYGKMDCLLMLSAFEGGPANLPEAIASGTPVLCTNVGMVPDMIRHGVNGLVLSGDPAHDSSFFYNLYDHDSGLLSTLLRGANVCNTAPTWEEVIDRHVALYESMVPTNFKSLSAI